MLKDFVLWAISIQPFSHPGRLLYVLPYCFSVLKSPLKYNLPKKSKLREI